jgi:hypothetical protein
MIEKISIREVLTILVLGAVNIMAVLYGYNELAMSISSGLVGYLGGRESYRKEQNKWN